MIKSEVWKFHACLGYSLLILGIGTPIWWATTTVYRANLPYESIEALQEPKISLNVLLISSDAQDEHKLGPLLQSELSSSSRLLSVNFKSRLRSELEENAFKSLTDLAQLDQRLSQLHSKLNQDLILFEAPNSLFNSEAVLTLGSGKTILFKNGCNHQDLLKGLQSVLGISKLNNIALAIDSPTKDQNPSWTLRRPIAAPAFDVLFSLMIPEPEKFQPTWDIENAVKAYFEPVLNNIKGICDVSVKSQILYLANLSLKPKKMDGLNIVNENELGLSINIGSQLSSHVTSRPTLNFLTYIPTQRQSPLKILDKQKQIVESNAFLVPRWGGVLVLNTNQTQIEMDILMKTFLTQFRQLIGLDHYDMKIAQKISKEIIAPLEKDFLLKLGIVENLAVAKLTMESLSHLLTQISNIVINEEVSEQVYSAVSDYKQALDFSASGQVQEAFAKSQTSFISAEKAFFDDTLLALLYFPSDQKYAIYIPLFLPVFISFGGIFMPFVKSIFKK